MPCCNFCAIFKDLQDLDKKPEGEINFEVTVTKSIIKTKKKSREKQKTKKSVEKIKSIILQFCSKAMLLWKYSLMWKVFSNAGNFLRESSDFVIFIFNYSFHDAYYQKE